MKINYKNYIIIGLIFIILLASFLLYRTYAKYITSINSDTEMGIARWNIKVNNTSITNGSNFSNIITPVFPGNANIAPNVIAPTAEGYFDINLDATDTDVSLRYTITTSDNENSSVTDLIISGYSIDGGTRVNITPSDTPIAIQNTIAYDALDKDIDIRVYLKWNDDEQAGATMDNADDTDTTTDADNKAIINVDFNIIQIPNS